MRCLMFRIIILDILNFRVTRVTMSLAESQILELRWPDVI